LSAELQQLIGAAEEKTFSNTGLQLSIAANYGGRWDILQAAKKMATELQESGNTPDSISEDDFGKYLCLGDLPTVDLCIRTSGEQRVSNFLLWQMAYAEFVFVDALWPEFKHQKMVDTLVQFGQRQRRFGQTGAQLIEQESKV
jgi:undecaprenyl diphosphate synthase